MIPIPQEKERREFGPEEIFKEASKIQEEGTAPSEAESQKIPETPPAATPPESDDANAIRTETIPQHGKSELQQSIETILSTELLTRIFQGLPQKFDPELAEKNVPFSQEDFLISGEKCARAIELAITNGEADSDEIQNIVGSWLSLIPNMKKGEPFVEQEKINIVKNIADYIEKNVKQS